MSNWENLDRYTLKFVSEREARSAARALKWRGFDVSYHKDYVDVYATPKEIYDALSEWAKNRGVLLDYVILKLLIY